MTIQEELAYLNSADGPNIPMRTLGVYCGVNVSTICRTINGKLRPSRELEKQIDKGIHELVQEIVTTIGLPN